MNRRHTTTAFFALTAALLLSPLAASAAVDGSAHISKDRGFLFLFALGTQAARASIPLNRWLGLDERPATLYHLKEVCPCEGTDLGIYKYGEEFYYDMPVGSAVIIALEPAVAGAKAQRPVPSAPQRQVLVVPAFPSAKPSNLDSM